MMADKTHFNQIDQLIKSHKIVLFMKGDPQFPYCGFSASVSSILKNLEVDFYHVDVLSDDNIRQAIKNYTDWPTIPQLYINGEFIGGSDIVTELFNEGKLQQIIKGQENEKLTFLDNIKHWFTF